jgi:23S rRNA pseudouridine2605 synthase
MRIAKYIANAGLCSRREAEKLIMQKKVYINGSCCEHPSEKVSIIDKIIVNKQIIKIDQKIRLWKMYKPVKIICTNHDPQKRKTIFSLIPKNYPRLISIGRLDFMSEGLILFTNNGDFARKYELPSSNILRVYRVCINGQINSEDIKKINSGIIFNKIEYKKVNVRIEKYKEPYTWLIFKMKEGKNREIRNICDYFLWNIVNLVRIQYGSIKLIKQRPGEIIEIKNFNNIL